MYIYIRIYLLIYCRQTLLEDIFIPFERAYRSDRERVPNCGVPRCTGTRRKRRKKIIRQPRALCRVYSNARTHGALREISILVGVFSSPLIQITVVTVLSTRAPRFRCKIIVSVEQKSFFYCRRKPRRILRVIVFLYSRVYTHTHTYMYVYL